MIPSVSIHISFSSSPYSPCIVAKQQPTHRNKQTDHNGRCGGASDIVGLMPGHGYSHVEVWGVVRSAQVVDRSSREMDRWMEWSTMIGDIRIVIAHPLLTQYLPAQTDQASILPQYRGVSFSLQSQDRPSSVVDFAQPSDDDRRPVIAECGGDDPAKGTRRTEGVFRGTA